MITYLLWSNKHDAWWRPDGRGYTERIEEAGGYTEAEAVRAVVRSAGSMNREQVALMVVAPPEWKPPPAVAVMMGPGPLVDVLTGYLLAAGRVRQVTEGPTL